MGVPERLEEFLSFLAEPGPATFLVGLSVLSLLVSPPIRRRLRIGVTIAVLGGAVLLVATTPEGTYYKYVDEVLAEQYALRGKHLYVHGRVVDGSIEREVRNPSRYRFLLAMVQRPDHPYDPGRTLRVDYEGWVPDRFASGVEAVVSGRLRSDGTVEAVPDGIMTKCPSKY